MSRTARFSAALGYLVLLLGCSSHSVLPDEGGPSIARPLVDGRPYSVKWVEWQIAAYERPTKEYTSKVVRKIIYAGKPAYLLLSPCCDNFDYLYDAKGAMLCAPWGGIRGHGDGSCPGDVRIALDMNTPAYHALSEWLNAFESGDRATFESFEKARAPWLSLDGQMRLRERTGGYDVLSVEQSDKLSIVFRAQERATSAQIVGRLVVRSYDPGRITLLSLDPVGEKSTRTVMDEAQRARVLEGAAKLLEKFYVFPDVAKKVAAKLKAQRESGSYRTITDGEIFAVRLTDDLVAATGDKHVAVDFFANTLPAKPPASQHYERKNCGFEKTEQYPPNIAYLKLDSFEDPKHCAATAITTMNLLAASDALIVDLRDNRGGAPRMAALISSYFFDERTHVDDIYDRGRNTTEQLWTDPFPNQPFAGKPIFVLTSAKTFSAAEQFSYDLKALKRAILIGETTGGGAHLVAPHRIDDHFFIRVPFGRFTNPVTKTDWEGTGVEPDVKVSAAEALEVAKKLAAEEISKRH